jgi:serine/threonine-protein kinase RsbW
LLRRRTIDKPAVMPACTHDCGPRACTLAFEIAADAELLPQLLERISVEANRLWGEDSDKPAKLALALQEALANAVVHGCGEDKAKHVQCWVSLAPGSGVMAVVRDPGNGFDVTNEPTPLSDEARSFDHGRGIFLMRQLMDAVHFEGKGNEVHLRLT